jgi:hypothetical protein
MNQISSKIPPEDSVHSICPIQTIIFDDPIINETILSEHNIRYHVCFASHICLKYLSGFQKCIRLFRIEIPASVEVIKSNAFECCVSLHAVVFRRDSRIREIHGFRYCQPLRRIEIQSGSPIQNLPFFRAFHNVWFSGRCQKNGRYFLKLVPVAI